MKGHALLGAAAQIYVGRNAAQTGSRACCTARAAQDSCSLSRVALLPVLPVPLLSRVALLPAACDEAYNSFFHILFI